jgi:hypothetical protein
MENPSGLRYLLAAKGKRGADSQVATYVGKKVRLRGTLIHRDDQKMIALSGDSIAALGDAQPQGAPKTLGEFDLVGEIVDSKCYLGNMNPGNGKVHRDCAVRCLSGGIPPLFATNDFNGSPAVLQVIGPNQKRLPKAAFLDRVAQPMRIHGRVMQIGNTLLLETESSAIASGSFWCPPEQGHRDGDTRTQEQPGVKAHACGGDKIIDTRHEETPAAPRIHFSFVIGQGLCAANRRRSAKELSKSVDRQRTGPSRGRCIGETWRRPEGNGLFDFRCFEKGSAFALG